MSMLSMNGSEAFMSSNRRTAVYKGLTVAVYTVNKTEINLTRQDLVELINVCSVFSRLIRDKVCLCPCKHAVCYGNSSQWNVTVHLFDTTMRITVGMKRSKLLTKVLQQ